VAPLTVATRFADLPAWAARLLMAAVLLLCVLGSITTLQPTSGTAEAVVDLTDTDLALYQAIAERVGEGEGYYKAAVAEQRARNYPLRPFVTVRQPTLAWIVGLLGPEGAALLLKGLMAAALLGLAVRLKGLAGSAVGWGSAAVLAAAGLSLLTVPAMTFWHESWAALLIILSLACRTSRRWLPSVLIGLAAVLVRELALPFLGVMALLAWREGNRREAYAWAAAILISLGAVALHASAVAALVSNADPSSPGWSGAGGWPFVLGMMQRCSLFLFLPLPVIAILVPLSLLGWASFKHPLAERAALLLLGYAAAFTLLGRPDNFYWGILIAPILPIGLAFAPRALRDLCGALDFINRRRSRVTG
jgi:hypothetical protein